MKKRNRNISRKEFVKTTSKGVLAAGLLSAIPGKAIAARPGRSVKAGNQATGIAGENKLATSMLGNTGIKATRLGVGAPRIQEPSVLRYALNNGITFIDTGRRYANGKNELMVGEVIKGKRKDLVIQSKVSVEIEKDKSDNEPLSKKIRDIFNKSLEESLEALQTDYIDIMLLHDGNTKDILYHDALLDAFSKAKKEGKILAHGYSGHVGINEAIIEHNEKQFYDVLMYSFNAHGGYNKPNRDYWWDQEALIGGLKEAVDRGTGIVAMKTCISGPYCCDGDPEATYAGAVKWVLQQPYIHSSAVAMANFQQLDEHLTANKT